MNNPNERVRYFMKLNGTEKAVRKMVEAHAKIVLFAAEGDPEHEQKLLKRTFEILPDMIIERMLPVLTEHFNDEDVEKGIAFWESDLGKKMAESNAQLEKRLAPVTEHIFQEAARQAERELGPA